MIRRTVSAVDGDGTKRWNWRVDSFVSASNISQLSGPSPVPLLAPPLHPAAMLASKGVMRRTSIAREATRFIVSVPAFVCESMGKAPDARSSAGSLRATKAVSFASHG